MTSLSFTSNENANKESVVSDMHVSPEQFALAVVASSSNSLSISEKFNLYSDAYKFALSKNKTPKTSEPTEGMTSKDQVELLTKLGL